MKWLWLLVVPYTVLVGSEPWRVTVIREIRINGVVLGYSRVECGNSYEACEDLAESLNAAHERRMQPDNGWRIPAYGSGDSISVEEYKRSLKK